MRRTHFFVSLLLALVWLGSGAGLAAPPRAAGDSAVQAMGPDQVPTGLTPSEWQRIQAQVARLTAADGEAEDRFGFAVSVSGDMAVVGAQFADVGGNTDQGAAYVFYRDQGGPDAWGQVAKLTADDGTAIDHFGSSVSVSGDTAVVGAYRADVDGNTDQGATYVFYRDQGGPDAWGQVVKLTAADGAAGNWFGSSVSISGGTAVVGAFPADVGGKEHQGAAYVFYRNQDGPDAWGQAARLTAADGEAEDGFGFAVSVSGDMAVVGAQFADVGGNADQGAAYVFYRDQGGPDAWGQVAKLTADDGTAGDGFGSSVSVSGDTAVVGAYRAGVDGNTDQGAAYVFYRNQGGPDAWGQVVKLTAADGAAGNWFGSSVSVSGGTAVVGVPYADVGDPNQGAAYVFCRNQDGPDAWGQADKLTAADAAASDRFGFAVSVSGDAAVVGAQFADGGGNVDQGAAYVYGLTTLPVAADDAYATPEDTPLLVPAALGVLANDVDPDDDPLTAVLDTGPTHGALDLHADGSFTYTPTADYAGLDTLTYHADDGAANSNVATVQILVYTHAIYLPLVLRNG